MKTRRAIGLLIAAGAWLGVACRAPARDPELAVSSVAPVASAAPPASSVPPAASASVATTSELAPLQWGHARVQFATVDAARAVLGERDGFVRAMSAFDRSLRRGTNDSVDEKAYLAHAAAQALPWPEAARGKWHAAGVQLQQALAGLELPLPASVLLVISTGREELGAPHTRGSAIVLPAMAVEKARSPLRLLAHELLHVSTRHQPQLRDPLYAVLGYQRVEPVPYPAELEARRLTNPDAYDNDHALQVELKKKKVLVAPVLASKLPPAEAAGASLGDFFDLRLVELDPRGAARKNGAAGGLILLDVGATDYLGRSSINTDYAIHPEEVLADNFAHLIERRAGIKVSVPRPEILDALESALGAGKSP